MFTRANRTILASVATAVVVAVLVSAGPAFAQEPPDPDPAPPAPVAPDPGGIRMRHPILFSIPYGPLPVPDSAAGVAPAEINPTPRGGYTPAQMRAYLGLSGDGRGQTIGITVAFHTPTIRADVARFSTYFNLPLPCDEDVIDEFTNWRRRDQHRFVRDGGPPEDCFPFVVANPSGAQTIDDTWAMETALDVEWAHAIAPRAKILLVEAESVEAGPLFAAIDYAASHGASVISNSWLDEEFEGERIYDRHCRLTRAVCVFAAGDDGHEATYPAANPYALAVGGTTLTLDDSGNVMSETAWGGSGGGVSVFERRPRYQTGFHPYPMRGTPDVSYNADIRTGFAVFVGSGAYAQIGWLRVAGTSAGAPQWAAIIAVADQLRESRNKRPFGAIGASTIHRALYRMKAGSTLFDVITGSNGDCGVLCGATTGYDFITGLGSPRQGIDAALAAAP